MIRHTINEDFDQLNSDSFLEVYNSQKLIHQDYFHHPLFQYACVSVFSKYSRCYLLTVFMDDNLIGYAVLRMINLSVRKINHKFLVPVGYLVSEYNYPIIDKRYNELFFLEFDIALKGFNVHFPCVPGYFRKTILDCIKHSFVNRITENPIIRSKQEIYNCSRKSSTRKKFRQLDKKSTNVEIIHLTNGVNEELLDKFYEMHVSRWKLFGVNSQFGLKEMRDVIAVIINLKIENKGTPILSYLKVDGEYLAFQMGFIMGDTFLSQTRARSLNDINISAGSILMKEVLEYCLQNKIEIYDTGIGLEKYKYSYMNEVRTYYNVLKFKNPIYSFVSRINLK